MNFEIKLFDDKQRGMMAALANDSHISKWCVEAQSIVSDQTVPLHILSLFKEGDTVVDVGAFIGDHAVAYAERVGFKGQVLAFEPYRPAFACLAVNCRELSQAYLYNVALGAAAGSANIIMPADANFGTVSIKPTSPGDTRVTALDNLQLSSCAFIKIDVEGYEPEVIKGAIETIKRYKPIMYIELNDAALKTYGCNKESVLELLNPLGYSHEFIDPSHSLEMPQVDVIMRPK